MDKVGCDVICKSHSARSDRDQYRICPTKLSKPELEHLYFALLENNLELKKTVNIQQDRIKVLSTKMQRMTSAQKVLQADEKKDCCVATKAVVNQQKEMITDLKRSNERMAERIRKMNMRLCSAKQFCKSATPRCLRCSTATSPYLIKHSPSSYKQHSQSTLKFAVSCQNLSRDAMITKCVQTESCDTAKQKEAKSCEDNKCRTLLDELKQKIVNLQEELVRAHNESSSRLRSLEGELQQSRGDVVRARSERVAADHGLGRKDERIASLLTSLRAAEGLSTELKTQLSIEKRKVAELETRLKAATMSNRVTQTIADTLTSIQESNKSTATDVTLTCAWSPRSHNAENVQQTYTGLSAKDSNYCDETKLSKSADDSGYIDANKSQSLLDDQSLNKIIEELTNRILVLQTQVDSLTISPPEVNTLDSRAKAKVDHLTTTEDLYDIRTEIQSSQPVLKTNLVAPSQVAIEKRKDKPEEQIKLNSDTKPETTIDEITVTSSKHDQKDNQIPTSKPGSEPGESAGWKAGVTKLTTVARITSDKEVKTKENVDEGNGDNTGHISKGTDNNNDQDEELSDTSISIEEKTYNVPTKDKNVAEIEKVKKDTKDGKIDETDIENIPEIDEKNDKIDKKVPDKDLEKDKNDNNTGKKDQIARRDSNKSGNKEKAAGQKNIGSPKRLLTDNVDIEQKLNEKELEAVNKIRMHKSVEQRKPLMRSKTLVRAQTEIQTESTCEEATYTVDCDKSAGDNSPDNTDFEISSMTDLTEEREPKTPIKNRLSPGEQKYTSTQTDSIASPSTNYSLSEGEIPITSVRRKDEDKPRIENGPRTAVPKMEETLQAITDELARCKRLLFSQRSYDSVMTTNVKNENKLPMNSSSVQRWASTS